MAGQHFVFLETINGMKRALSRADDGKLPVLCRLAGMLTSFAQLQIQTRR